VNNKIFRYLQTSLKNILDVQGDIGPETVVLDLPWTAESLEFFHENISCTFELTVSLRGTLGEITEAIDEKYSRRFWGHGIWQPRTAEYVYSGLNIVNEINKLQPKAVLDVGCRYNQFKSLIPNLTGIDKYNTWADQVVDIRDYQAPPEHFDAVIVFGGINFGEYADVSAAFKKVFELTAPGGRVYVRANPGGEPKQYLDAKFIDIFAWDQQAALMIAQENSVSLITFIEDSDRLFFEYQK